VFEAAKAGARLALEIFSPEHESYSRLLECSGELERRSRWTPYDHTPYEILPQVLAID
jgi:hypothetical protein